MFKSLIVVALLLPGFVYCAASREVEFPREKYLELRLREKGSLFEACWLDDFEGVALHSEHIDKTNSPDLLMIASHCRDGGHCRDINGDSAHVKIMRLLLEQGCIDTRSVTSVLYVSAIRTRCLAAVEVLIEHGADVNYAYQGRSMLHVAVLRGKWMTVAALLNAGADIRATDNEGQTPEERIARLPVHCRPSMERTFDNFKRDQSCLNGMRSADRAWKSDKRLS